MLYETRDVDKKKIILNTRRKNWNSIPYSNGW